MTQLAKRLIPKDEINKLFSKLTNPRAICQKCGGRVDCIGIEECYPIGEFLMIEIKIMKHSQAEIVGMVNS